VAAAEAAAAAMVEKQDTCSLEIGLSYEQPSRSVRLTEEPLPVVVAWVKKSRSSGSETEEGKLDSG
jgi:hypothetical protein